MIALLRAHGYDAPIYLHGALMACCELYERLGVRLGSLAGVRRCRAQGRCLEGSCCARRQP
jgi:putative mRNA 3-end processing factor